MGGSLGSDIGSEVGSSKGMLDGKGDGKLEGSTLGEGFVAGGGAEVGYSVRISGDTFSGESEVYTMRESLGSFEGEDLGPSNGISLRTEIGMEIGSDYSFPGGSSDGKLEVS